MEEVKKRVFDEEAQRALAGCLPFTEDAFVEYIPKAYRKVGKELQAVFLLAPYSEETMKRFAEAGGKLNAASEEDKPKVIEAFYDAQVAGLKDSVRGWRNYGVKEIPFDSGKIGDRRIIPPVLFAELHERCLFLATGALDEEEKEGLG